MSIYSSRNRRSLDQNCLNTAKINNQVIITNEINPTFLVGKGIFFLELLQLSGSNTVTIKNGLDETMGTGVVSFIKDHTPVRCDYGIKFTGDVQFAVGYFIEGVFS